MCGSCPYMDKGGEATTFVCLPDFSDQLLLAGVAKF